MLSEIPSVKILIIDSYIKKITYPTSEFGPAHFESAYITSKGVKLKAVIVYLCI